MPSTVDFATKGLWLPDDDARADAEVTADRPSLFDGPFTWPVMVARRSAIEANIATVAAYCDRHGVAHAPHGKTTMAPSLFAAQLAAGAWAITVATANQAAVAHRFGAPRVLLASEVLDAKVLRWAAERVGRGWEFLCYVDSLAGVEVLRQAAGGPGPSGVRAPDGDLRAPGRLRVLVEIGYPGGRTGCRDVDTAVEVARAAVDVAGVEVAGVAGFEGMLPDVASVRRFLDTMLRAGEAIAPLCPAGAPMLFSAGGSAYFDTVVEVAVPVATRHGWRVVLRSGSYVAHDDGLYADTGAFTRVAGEGFLTAALEVFAQVLSNPEPGLSILGAGKRDLPFDEGLPVAKWVRGGGAVRPLDGAVVERLNDQHAYLRGADLTPGSLVCLGISHPCTAFDKWRVVPVVDDDYRVVDLLHTYF
jgi:D-serine deaminase-like pyridoxal phosphate-dependent protein